MVSDENYALLRALSFALEQGERVVLATVVQSRGSVPRRAGTKMLIYTDGKTVGTVGGGEMESRVLVLAQEVVQTGEPQALTYQLVDPKRGDPGVCGGEVQIYLERYSPPATLFVIGAGHVGRAVAHLAKWLGWRVVVQDDRPEFAQPEQIPDADLLLPVSIEEALHQFTITANTYIAVVTRNVLIDRQILPHLLPTPAPYIGIIGSRRRWAETKRLLMTDGFDEADLSRFHSPIGLELAAETPEEIAVSIMAEIIMLKRGGSGQRMATT